LFPFAGRDFPAHDREVTLITHLAEKAKAEFHDMIQMRVNTAEPLVRGVKSANTPDMA